MSSKFMLYALTSDYEFLFKSGLGHCVVLICINCIIVTLQAEVTLETSHIGKGCDRDTYNLASQRQLCGASDLAIDLLPDPQHVRKVTD